MVLKFLDTQQGRQLNPRFKGFFPFLQFPSSPPLLWPQGRLVSRLVSVKSWLGGVAQETGLNRLSLQWLPLSCFIFLEPRLRDFSFDSWPSLLASALLPWNVDNRTGRNKTRNQRVRRWAPCPVPVGGTISCLCTQPWLEPALLKFFVS